MGGRSGEKRSRNYALKGGLDVYSVEETVNGVKIIRTKTRRKKSKRHKVSETRR